MKYKVGDKVRIRADLENKTYGAWCYCNEDMVAMKGQVREVSEANEYCDTTCYYLKGVEWNWVDEMLEPVVEQQPFVTQGATVYKPGDRVRIRTDMETGQCYGNTLYTNEMDSFAGQVLTVDFVTESNRYMLNGSDGFIWSAEMLAPAEDEEPHIKDSGERTEYDTGAVRDCKAGKGRCDLMPLDVLVDLFGPAAYDSNVSEKIFWNINEFKKTAHTDSLLFAVCAFEEFLTDDKSDGYSIWEMLMDLSKHFEEGALKYGECNWQKGIPVHSYIDSAIRHYLKYMAGWADEHHDRAFVWNLVCCVWTMQHHPELDDFTEKSENR